jgi:hypothetical protein
MIRPVLAHCSHHADVAAQNLHQATIYHLFSKLKESLPRKTFSDDDEVQNTVMTLLREQAGDFYDAGIKKLDPW